MHIWRNEWWTQTKLYSTEMHCQQSARAVKNHHSNGIPPNIHTTARYNNTHISVCKMVVCASMLLLTNACLCGYGACTRTHATRPHIHTYRQSVAPFEASSSSSNTSRLCIGVCVCTMSMSMVIGIVIKNCNTARIHETAMRMPCTSATKPKETTTERCWFSFGRVHVYVCQFLVLRYAHMHSIELSIVLWCVYCAMSVNKQ